MEFVKKVIEFVAQNKDLMIDFGGLVAMALVSLGGAIELFLRLMPTKSPDSLLERMGKLLVKVGEMIRKALDKVRMPNKEKPSDKPTV